MKKVVLLLSSLFMFTTSAFATNYSFVGTCTVDCGFFGPVGNTRTFAATDDGLIASIRAYNTPLFSDGGLFTSGFLSNPAGGLGVTASVIDTSSSIDDFGHNDLILIEFANYVNLNSIDLDSILGGDTDFVAYLGGAASGLDISGTSYSGLAGLGFTFLGTFTGGSSDRTALFSTVLTGNYLIIGAPNTATGFGNENFLISGLSTTQVPEPATMALMGLGLAGLGAVRRKKA